MNIRNKRVVKKVDLKNGVGLELGPLTSPVVTKKEGNIYYLDHMSQEDLKKKYKTEPVELDKIVPVDYVLKNTLKETVGKKKFDYVIASHVIEHIPDTISWLKEINDILKPGGVLSLVIPDKRFTFDFDRRLTDPSEVIGAYIDRLKKPTSAMMYDFAIHCADGIDTATAWKDKDHYYKHQPKRRWSHDEAVAMCARNQKGIYVDCHCHVYTPTSFIEILKELTKNDLIDFEVCSFLPTQEYEIEFYVALKKVGKESSKANRLRKLPKIHEKTKLDIVNERLKELEGRSRVFENEIESIRTSLSWRVTAPIRKASSAVRKRRE